MVVHLERWFDAPPDQVRSAAVRAFARADDGLPLRVVAQGEDGGARARFEADLPPAIPYFQWLVGFNFRRVARKFLRWVAESVEAELAGTTPPEPPKRSVFSPPTTFDHHQASVLATVSLIMLVAGVGASLFSQNVDFITESYGVSERAIGVASAVSRVGVLVALVASALVDRMGRRRILLLSVAGVCVSSALSALAPTLPVFAAFQLIGRGWFNAVFVVGLIVAVEEAPEGGRAYSGAILTLAFGGGGAVATALLPLGDLGSQTWRLAFVANALMIVLLPSLARHLPESARYQNLAARKVRMGRLGELVGPRYRRRLLLVLALALLTNVLAAPSSFFANRFLGDERGFSGLEIAVFRGITGGIPGFVGLFVGGRIAETWGRKRVAIWGTVAAVVATTAFYVSDGAALWALGTAELFLSAVAAPALQAFGPEMFATEIRGTANAAILVTGLTGSAVGLVAAGALSETLSLGSAIAVLGVFPLLAAVLLIPWLPEAAHKDLDVVSPPEI